MFIKKKRPWEIPEAQATPESVYMGRRRFLREMGNYTAAGGFFLSGFGSSIFGIFEDKEKEGVIKVPSTPTSNLYPALRNKKYILDRPLTEELIAGRYNNFYEFSSGKSVWKHVDRMEVRPWTVEVAGLVEKPRVYDVDEIVRMMTLEERLYRLRCVEAWAMAVPWTGFPMKDFIKRMNPLSTAKYVKMQTFMRPEWASGQRVKFWQPWPYEEGLTMEEATNELAMLVTGIYGHELPRQHGAPIRLIVPWKYGYKSIKSIVRIEFTATRPATFWNTAIPHEYDFPANVNPNVPHPRWSQETEEIIGTNERRPTIIYNGYGDFVKGLY
ncbi:MAG TPA: protein-methionine-sulfoxide reductase catalytic subunit MsrP [Deltaproteobacteria bacterium]|nr:MAG: mononuclear molybdenum enzyme YedY [Deltaproteobacteria bacterium GWA2_55_82]OGQ62953.1 MAG: mononuclear molybdenum enzyme YedY [Deltaproteobacteria bacterium RIFCSPLOWO2_02_FULL_55_12]OIJ72915.1 MAG: mononuclear molybdenum enzyme YedY [Deltaproteobacteria bacterium GWC2_55_46]HBG46200.1 protein-methionine-sulfoxide reductase catalytic subunit MsrP [Deltaproteobacteria bacterium]HCY11698.1 protein-methionine-sulfoxide reductase catalytic subunit MsrP [Deltaproteobacteria bacterium]